MLEPLTGEFKQRTCVVCIFPNAASCCRQIRALAAETCEDWLEDTRYTARQNIIERKMTSCATPLYLNS
ncbi:MAG: transposase [Aestuariivirga sp.]|nr:transposase [Aestuariivirga sp.]